MRLLSSVRFGSFTLALLISFGAFAQSADLGLVKFGPDLAAAGGEVTWTLTLTNGGPDDAVNATIDDPLTGGMTFVSASQNSGPLFTCSVPPVGGTGTISCAIALLPAGATAEFSFVMTIPADAADGTFFTNIATATTTTADPNGENDTGVASTLVPNSETSDLSIAKLANVASTGPDTDIVFTIDVVNGGPDAATALAMSDTLPGDLTFVSLTQSGSPLDCSSTPAPGSGGTVTCTAASYPAGAATTITLTTHVPLASPSGTEYTNTATISSATPDPNSENDASSTTVFVKSADLSITKSGPATASAGDTIDYAITVTNLGAELSTSIAVIDAIPAGSTFVSLAQPLAQNHPCVTPAPGENGTITCSFSLAPAASASFTLTLLIGDTLSLTNTATVGSSEVFDPNQANNSASATTAITPVANLGIVKSGAASAIAGGTVSWTINATNAGPSTATAVTLDDVIPAGTTFVSFAQNAGPVFSCTLPAAGATVGSVSCTIPSFAPTASAAFTLTLGIPLGTTAPISNTATIASTVVDPDPTDNSSTATTTVVPPSSDVTIVKSVAAGYEAGGNATFTIVVTNNGPDPAYDVVVSDALPDGMTFVSATTSAGSCNAASPVVCSVGTLANGTSATITIVATIPFRETAFTNTASVTTASVDPDPADNSSAVIVGVTVDIPSLSVEGLLLMTLLLGGAALFVMRR